MKCFLKLISCAALLVVLVSTGATQSFGKKGSSNDKSKKVAVSEPAQPSVPSDYIIGAEDVLMVNVWREPEMSREVPVRPDGKISLPLLGEFMAAGKTPVELQNDLKKKLETVVTNPEVTVIVKDIRSQKFSILGEVSKPGSYPLTKPMSVLDAIAMAGGFKDFANPKKMYILRRTADGGSQRIPFDYNRMLKGDNRQRIIELESRDTIVVP